MDKFRDGLLVALGTIGILAGTIYIANHQPRIDCWNFFGLTKGCTASVNPQ